MSSYFQSAPDYFTNPSFSIDSTGAFGGTANSLISSPFGSGSSIKPTGMDPFSAVLGIGSIGASIFGASQQKSAAEQAASEAAEASKYAAAQTAKAAKIGAKAQLGAQLGGFGLDYLTSRYEGGAGGALNRYNALKEAADDANFQANNPGLMTLRSVQRYNDRLQAAMPGYTPPSNLFV